VLVVDYQQAMEEKRRIPGVLRLNPLDLFQIFLRKLGNLACTVSHDVKLACNVTFNAKGT